jgi:hypothetical protein
MELNLSLLDTYETLLKEGELFLVHHAQVHDPNNLYLLKTIPVVGKILALVMLYEIPVRLARQTGMMSNAFTLFRTSSFMTA